MVRGTAIGMSAIILYSFIRCVRLCAPRCSDAPSCIRCDVSRSLSSRTLIWCVADAGGDARFISSHSFQNILTKKLTLQEARRLLSVATFKPDYECLRQDTFYTVEILHDHFETNYPDTVRSLATHAFYKNQKKLILMGM